jgi:hypothetical protein
MSWVVSFAISAAVSVASTMIQSHFAEKRQDQIEALAAEKLRLQQQKATFEAEEGQNVINRERRLATARRRSIATGQGQTVETGLGSSSNLADTAIASSATGATDYLGKHLSSSLALSQADFDIATFDNTPGMVEQLLSGSLGAIGSVASSIGTADLKNRSPFTKDGKGLFDFA